MIYNFKNFNESLNIDKEELQYMIDDRMYSIVSDVKRILNDSKLIVSSEYYFYKNNRSIGNDLDSIFGDSGINIKYRIIIKSNRKDYIEDISEYEYIFNSIKNTYKNNVQILAYSINISTFVIKIDFINNTQIDKYLNFAKDYLNVLYNKINKSENYRYYNNYEFDFIPEKLSNGNIILLRYCMERYYNNGKYIDFKNTGMYRSLMRDQNIIIDTISVKELKKSLDINSGVDSTVYKRYEQYIGNLYRILGLDDDKSIILIKLK